MANPPTLEEILAAIKSIQSGKTPGLDRTPAESYKYGTIRAKILLKRLQNIAEVILPETQCGFRRSRSTIDMIFIYSKNQSNNSKASI